MEKVIEKLEKHIEGLKNITGGYHREIEELNGNAQEYESTIEEKRQYIKELKKALAVTEKKSDSSHQYLLDELERSRRIKERQEEYLIGVRKEIEEIEKSLQEVVEQIKDVENTINELKGKAPKTIPSKVWEETACCGGWVKPLEIDGALGEQPIHGMNIKIDAQVIGDTFSVVAEGVGKSFVERMKDNISALNNAQIR